MKRKASASPRTPRSKATNLTPEQETSVRKELVFANVVCDEIKLSGHKSTVHKKRILQNLVAGNLIKKYKQIRKLGEKTGMSRNKLSKVTTKNLAVKKMC